MAFDLYKGSFVVATGSSQSITGVGFRPKGLFIFAVPDAPAAFDTFGDGHQLSLGFGIAGIQTSRPAAVVGTDNVATSDLWNVIDTNEPFQALGDAGGGTKYTRRGGRVDSFDADGFTVSWNINPTGEYDGKVFHYLAFGGDFVITAPSATEPVGTSSPETYNPYGASRIRSLPVAQILVESSNTTAFVLQKGTLGIGLVGNVAETYTQGALAIASLDGVNPSSTYRYQKLGRCSLGLDDAGAVRREGLVTAFSAHIETYGTDTGLFHGQVEYEWPTPGTGEVHDFTIGAGLDELEGIGLCAAVVTITQPAATGSQVIADLGFSPVGMVVIGAGGTTSTSVQHASFGVSVGAADGTRQGVVWSADTQNVSPTVTACRHSDGAVLLAGTPAATGSASTLTAQAAVTEFDPAGSITLDWTVTDGTAREFLALILGSGPIVVQSEHNLLTGSTHTVDGSDNFIAGVGGTVTGSINALFALCDESPPPSITANRTFKVCASVIDLTAPTVTLNGSPLGDPALSDLTDVAIGSPLADGDVLTYDSGTATWGNVAPTAATRAVGITIDGGGAAITTGVKGDIYIPYSGTITAVTMLADQSGSAVVDIWSDAYGNYPPTVADTITASAKPTITTATKSQDTTLTGWTTTITAGDTLRFSVDSATTIERLTLVLTVTL
jgi:hypothetical protein